MGKRHQATEGVVHRLRVIPPVTLPFRRVLLPLTETPSYTTVRIFQIFMEIKLMKGGEIWRSVEKSTNDLFNAVKEIMPPTDEADELMEDIETFRYMVRETGYDRDRGAKSISILEKNQRSCLLNKLTRKPMLRIFVKDNRITEAIIHADGVNLPVIRNFRKAVVQLLAIYYVAWLDYQRQYAQM
ncbi:uncharacterized protein LOC124144160 [Haliotis rufescens]|uniref:uncharacterized protein LOC124144160 n=1 Tax=Haliotis rufescens TaxID=6454 RepID=UPI001EB03A03|nr:uncharacterized protein LOC124144160 [Haliotis rufescens]